MARHNSKGKKSKDIHSIEIIADKLVDEADKTKSKDSAIKINLYIKAITEYKKVITAMMVDNEIPDKEISHYVAVQQSVLFCYDQIIKALDSDQDKTKYAKLLYEELKELDEAGLENIDDIHNLYDVWNYYFKVARILDLSHSSYSSEERGIALRAAKEIMALFPKIRKAFPEHSKLSGPDYFKAYKNDYERACKYHDDFYSANQVFVGFNHDFTEKGKFIPLDNMHKNEAKEIKLDREKFKEEYAVYMDNRKEDNFEENKEVAEDLWIVDQQHPHGENNYKSHFSFLPPLSQVLHVANVDEAIKTKFVGVVEEGKEKTKGVKAPDKIVKKGINRKEMEEFRKPFKVNKRGRAKFQPFEIPTKLASIKVGNKKLTKDFDELYNDLFPDARKLMEQKKYDQALDQLYLAYVKCLQLSEKDEKNGKNHRANLFIIAQNIVHAVNTLTVKTRARVGQNSSDKCDSNTVLFVEDLQYHPESEYITQNQVSANEHDYAISTYPSLAKQLDPKGEGNKKQEKVYRQPVPEKIPGDAPVQIPNYKNVLILKNRMAARAFRLLSVDEIAEYISKAKEGMKYKPAKKDLFLQSQSIFKAKRKQPELKQSEKQQARNVKKQKTQHKEEMIEQNNEDLIDKMSTSTADPVKKKLSRVNQQAKIFKEVQTKPCKTPVTNTLPVVYHKRKRA